MTLLWLVSHHVNRQKRDLMQYLLDNDACDPENAITMAGTGVKPSILRSLTSRNIVKRTAGDRYYLDPSRVNDAWGASNRFIFFAMGAFILVFLAIMLW